MIVKQTTRNIIVRVIIQRSSTNGTTRYDAQQQSQEVVKSDHHHTETPTTKQREFTFELTLLKQLRIIFFLFQDSRFKIHDSRLIQVSSVIILFNYIIFDYFSVFWAILRN